jgi:predicted MFS family arabinose efflux permease
VTDPASTRTARDTEPRPQHAALAVLAVSAFVYVTAETLPVGLLPEISHGLSVSEAQVGLLLTSYAAVAAATTIPLTAITMRIPRHRLIAATVAIFAISQLAAALAPNFAVLTIARLLCALAHGVFWSTIAPAAARLVPAGQAGRATALVFLGNSTALVLGVPLGTAIGQVFGWRIAVGAFALAGTFSLAALLFVLPDLPALPQDIATPARARIRSALVMIRSRAITPVCAVTTVLVVGHFAAYTYIAPLVRRSGDLEGFGLSALLLGYGVAGLVGNLLVARVVDRRPGPVLAGLVIAIVAALSLLALTPGPVLTVIAVLAWGAAFMAVPICLQTAILRVTPDTQDAASAVYVVAFQIGIGGGALLGERLIRAGQLGTLPILGAGLAVLAAGIVLASRRAFPSQVAAPGPVDEASGPVEEVSGSVDEVSGSVDKASGPVDEASGSVDDVSRSADDLDAASGSMHAAGQAGSSRSAA